MGRWKIHAIWAMTAILFGGWIDQRAADRQATVLEEARLKVRGLEDEIRGLKSRVAEAPAPAEATVDVRKPAAGPPVAAVVGSETAGDGAAGAPPAQGRNGSSRRGRRGTPQAPQTPPTPDEIRALLGGQNPNDTWKALRAIEALKDPAEKLALLREVANLPDPNLKGRALRLVQNLRGPDAEAIALGIAQGDGPSWLRSRAVSVVAEIGGPSAASSLESVYLNGSLETKISAAVALNKFGNPAPLREVIGTVGRDIENTDGARRQDAVETLGRLRSPDAVPYLRRALGDTDSDIRHAAIDALAATGSPEALPILLEAANDANPEIARAAHRAADRLQNPPANRHGGRSQNPPQKAQTHTNSEPAGGSEH